MQPRQLKGKEVIDSQAQIVGEVAGIEIDVAEWKVTHLLVNLSGDAIETLRYKKPFFGKVVIAIPVDVVKHVSDVVTLKESVTKLSGFTQHRDE